MQSYPFDSPDPFADLDEKDFSDDQYEIYYPNRPSRFQKIEQFRNRGPSRDWMTNILRFNQAYNKCVRLSAFIGNVPNVASIGNFDIRDKLLDYFDKNYPNVQRPYIAVHTTPGREGIPYQTCIVTIYSRGNDCYTLRDYVLGGIASQAINIYEQGCIYSLCVLSVGVQPVANAVVHAYEELEEMYAPVEDDTFNGFGSPPADSAAFVYNNLYPIPNKPLNYLPTPPIPLWPEKFNPREPAFKNSSGFILSKRKELEETLNRYRTTLLHFKEQPIQVQIDNSYHFVESQKIEYIEDYDNKDSFINAGAEGAVFRAIFHADKTTAIPCAIKLREGKRPFLMEQSNEGGIYLNNIAGVVKYYNHGEIKDGYYNKQFIAMELGLMDLDTFLRLNYPFSERERFLFAHNLIEAVSELHKKRPVIIHRDIRPENVMIMMDGRVALTDLGLSVQVKSYNRQSTWVKSQLTRAQPYEVEIAAFPFPTGANKNIFSPDISVELHDLPVSPAGDIFMLGNVIRILYDGYTIPFGQDEIRQKSLPIFSEEMQNNKPWLVHLLKHMLLHEKEERPTIFDVLQHPFITGIPELSTYLPNIFQTLDRLLRSEYGVREVLDLTSIEKKMEEDETNGTAWYTKLPQTLLKQTKFDKSVVIPGTRFRYLLPFVHWMRNILIHFGEKSDIVQTCRELKSTANPIFYTPGEIYSSAGEFFAHHPAVNWLLLDIWELHVQSMRDLRYKARVKEAELSLLRRKIDFAEQSLFSFDANEGKLDEI